MATVIVPLVLRYMLGKVTLWMWSKNWSTRECVIIGYIPMLTSIILAFLVGYKVLGTEALLMIAGIEFLFFLLLGERNKGWFVNLFFSIMFLLIYVLIK